MKQFSAVDLLYMAAELQQLINSRLSQIYQPSRKEIILQFHVTSRGRVILKVSVPSAVFMALGKESAAATGFCSLLRKKLNNTTLKAVSQPGFERILQLDFLSKNGLFSLFLELFSKGNIILVHEGKIAAAAEKQVWRSREVATGHQYVLPPAVTDPRTLDDKQLLQLIKSTNKTDIVRFAALELSLGGLYAEELCILSGIDKKTEPTAITAATAKKIIQSLKKLLTSKPSPSIIYENSKPTDVVPISLSYYKNHEKKSFNSFSEALETLYKTTAVKPSSYDAEISRLKAIIGQQQETINAARVLIEKNSRSGELIYEHYQEVKAILDAFKTGGWEAVRQLQKSNKKIKSFDEKKGKIVVDV